MKVLRVIGIVVLTAASSVLAAPDTGALVESARLAVEQGRYTEALQQLAQITVFHSRDAECMPAAVFYEGLVYKRTGRPEAARQAAADLVASWPGSEWSRRVDELK